MTRKYSPHYKGERHCLKCGCAFPYFKHNQKFCCALHRDTYNHQRRKLARVLRGVRL